MKRFTSLAMAVVLVSVCFLSLAFSQTKDFEVEMNTGHAPWYLYAPYVLGMEKGFFKEKGISLKLVPSEGGAVAADMVGKGKQHFVEVVALPIISTFSAGIPIRVIAVISYAPYSGAIFFWKDSGITAPRDLATKKIGSDPKSINRTPLLAFLGRNGGRLENIVNMPQDSCWQMFVNHKVDAYIGMLSSEKDLFERNKIQGYSYFLLKDFGITMPGAVLATNEAFLKSNPEVVKGFKEATLRSWLYAKNNPDEAITILVKRYPELNEQSERNRLKAALSVMQFSKGDSDEKMFQDAAQMLFDAGVIKKMPDIKKLIEYMEVK